ncbi:endolytic transglycosylase MltG [Patescibacteria group bacterium]|nr:endolytic transglycosylase MltG [Patescibacteria group bacterium]
MRKIKILFSLIILAGIAGLFLYFHEINAVNSNQYGDKTFIIEKGQGVETITRNLVDEGFLEQPFWFKLYVWKMGYETRFVDGEYDLRTDLSVKQLLEKFMTGQRTKETEIKIIEGWSVDDIDEYLAEGNLIERNELVKYGKDYSSEDWDFLFDRAKDASLEGYLYPDTYRVFKQTSLDAIVEKMLFNFDNKLTDEMRAEIKKQKKSIFKVVTLASIVEKEMFGYENRRVVAQVFWDRIDKGIPLQSDATVNYITKKGTTRPSLDDTKIDNPYNTYKYYGLPPGPICNPSIEAIRAVIYPADTDYLYFLTTPENEIIFSRTYDEHLRNARKYY